MAYERLAGANLHSPVKFVPPVSPTTQRATSAASNDDSVGLPDTAAANCWLAFRTVNPTTCREMSDASLAKMPFGDENTIDGRDGVTV